MSHPNPHQDGKLLFIASLEEELSGLKEPEEPVTAGASVEGGSPNGPGGNEEGEAKDVTAC